MGHDMDRTARVFVCLCVRVYVCIMYLCICVCVCVCEWCRRKEQVCMGEEGGGIKQARRSLGGEGERD